MSPLNFIEDLLIISLQQPGIDHFSMEDFCKLLTLTSIIWKHISLHSSFSLISAAIKPLQARPIQSWLQTVLLLLLTVLPVLYNTSIKVILYYLINNQLRHGWPESHIQPVDALGPAHNSFLNLYSKRLVNCALCCSQIFYILIIL